LKEDVTDVEPVALIEGYRPNLQDRAYGIGFGQTAGRKIAYRLLKKIIKNDNIVFRIMNNFIFISLVIFLLPMLFQFFKVF
jgi:hypothetical protein